MTQNNYECNICYESPKLPVVTQCGHLYWLTFLLQLGMHIRVDKLELRAADVPSMQERNHP